MHFVKAKEKDQEEVYIEEGLNIKKRTQTKFYHYEEKFSNHGQTVVIWCSKDFMRDKNHGGKIFTEIKREQRSRALAKRRAGISLTMEATVGQASSSSSSMSNVHPSVNAWSKSHAAHEEKSLKSFRSLQQKFSDNVHVDDENDLLKLLQEGN